jgi:ribosomal protein S8
MKKYTLKLLLMIAIIMFSFSMKVIAQESTKLTIDSLNQIVKSVQSEIKIMKNLKINGYLQSQWQKAQSNGAESFTGGDFVSSDKRYGLDNRFTVMKGRVRINYSSEFSQYVILFNVTERGMALKDLYASFTDPWTKTFTLTGGAFCRPIGYEVEYSSADLESAERSRIIQTLFPNEEDIGAKLTIQTPANTPMNFLKLDLAMVCGNGLNLETDSYKDFIAHIIANKKFMNDKLSVRLGASFYNGGWALPANITDVSSASTKKEIVYRMNNQGFIADSSYNKGDKLKREYYGLDAQVILKTVLGTTTLRSEYLFGKQPGTKNSSISPTGLQADAQTYTTAATDKNGTLVYATTADKPTYLNPYIRKFSGGYITFVQNLLNSKHDIVVRFDWYDPNTEIKKNEIGSGATWDETAKKITNNLTKTGYPDVAYSTLGIGWIYHWNTYVKLLAYYEIVTNETTNSAGFIEDAINTGLYDARALDKNRKDNIFTLRMQFKF